MDARFVLYLAQPSAGRLQEMLRSALAGTAYRLIRTPAQLAECRGAHFVCRAAGRGRAFAGAV